MRKTTANVQKREAFTGDMRAAQERYNLGRYSIEKIAEESHAKIRVGKRVIFNFEKIDSYLDSISE